MQKVTETSGTVRLPSIKTLPVSSWKLLITLKNFLSPLQIFQTLPTLKNPFPTTLFHQNTKRAPKKGAGSSKKGQDTRAPVDRSSTPFDFSRFHIPQVRRRVISTTLITPEARRILYSELMIQIFQSLEQTRIMGFLGFDLPRYSLARILEFFYNSRVDGDAVVSRVNREEIRITAESLQQQFDIRTEGLASTSQEQPSSFEEVLQSIAVPGTAQKELRRSMSTNLLREEYKMLSVLI